MNSLVNVVVFGIVGAVVMAALLGLLLVFAGRAKGTGPRVLSGAVSVVVLVALPTLAVLAHLRGGAGLGGAFLVALGVVVIVYAANVALLPLVARRAAADRGDARLLRLRPSPAMLAGGLVVCALLALVGTGLGALLS
ncbi:hypothetical protein ACQEU5_01665 [Marinactinospora thermotolerans]|uniref:Uncharacterized protein n=1 Tax=Marinactinospora thermotolerans DSM 45154 TaxID=1122192 RepID=A0A1T4M8E2_9ACTN|nr:hypothetical protein [Marinactinospora thermotolerans]SJZ63192.1 hypothetical protein SAMN02745673_00993 [Marinactinospora thermotolerans DSM 45154]